MTRETKIGLLVGLAFILVVGVLLSDHISTADRPAEAELATAGDAAREATRAPQAADLLGELVPEPTIRDAGTTDVARVDGPAVQTPIPLAAEAEGSITETMIDAPAGNDMPAAARLIAAEAGPLDADDPWANLIERRVRPAVEDGPVIADVGPAPAAEPSVASEPVAAATPTVEREVIEYVAKPGDSLSRIVADHLGRDTPANRAAVLALNPVLAADPDVVVAGRTYKVPARPAAGDLTLLAATAERETAATYTVKSGDSLWRIASAHAGGSNVSQTLAAIRRLNRDALDGRDDLKVGMTLQLPG